MCWVELHGCHIYAVEGPVDDTVEECIHTHHCHLSVGEPDEKHTHSRDEQAAHCNMKC